MMIIIILIFISLIFLIFWYLKFIYILPVQRKIKEYEKFYHTFEEFTKSILNVALSFHKEDYINLVNMIMIKLNNIMPDSVFYLIEKKGEELAVLGVINEGEIKIDSSKIKEIISATKDEFTYIERTDIFENEKASFFVLSLSDSIRKIFIISLINESEKEVSIKYFRFVLLILKVFLNYYSEIEKRNIEIKKLKMEMDSVIQELESQETKLIKKHKETKLIYEGISTFNSDLENPTLYLIELIYKSISPSFISFFCYNESKNTLYPLITQPSNFQIVEELNVNNSQNLCVKSFISGNPLYITDKHDLNQIPFAQRFNINTMLIFPVATSKIKYGIVVIADSSLRKYLQDDLSLIDITIKQLALLMNFSDLYNKLSQYAAKMENLNKIKDEFISSVNHEIKTPLTTIKGFLSVLLNGESGILNDQQMSFLNLVDQATNRLINIVTNLLDISKLNSKSEMELEKADMVELILTLLPSLRMKAYSKNIRILFETELKSVYVIMDKHWIGQVIHNLTDNAIKYSPPSTVIKMSVYDRGDVVVFCIEDQGYGIEEDDKKFIFEKFFRGKNVSFNTEGSGLGLAIAKTIIEKHDGKVWFESHKEKGSKFYFALRKS
ncbi:MAG: HAMP domain-containing histidine kinase [Elusimicrobiales bacterium]|nr:HAMP domain-containing histidine kinase [Elusimicrobiales bacterium]